MSVEPLTDRVTAAIQRLFAEPERTAVSRAIEQAGVAENVAIAILRVSRGKASRIPGLIEDARRDFRDVLAWAQQPSRTYIAGVLRKGPNWTGKVVHLELASLRKWKQAGQIVIGGLFRDESDARGLYIFAVESAAEAQAIAAEDPAVQSGELAFDFHRWLSADGLQVGPPFGHDL